VIRDTSDSTGVRKELGELFRWCHVSEGLAWPAVEARRDAGQIRPSPPDHVIGRLLDLSHVSWRTYVADQLSDHTAPAPPWSRAMPGSA